MNKKTPLSQCISNINEHSASLFLILLICADIAFIALHSINALTSFLNNPFYSLGTERGYSEMYQYLKWFWISILLVYVSILRRSFSYIVWVLVFAYFLCDDALRIHEDVGKHIARNLILTPPFGLRLPYLGELAGRLDYVDPKEIIVMLGLRLQDIGELAVSAAAGLILSPLVIWAYLHGSQAFKKMSQDMLLLILALAFFGVFVDMADISIDLGEKVAFILEVIEDGGEMLVASLILWYVFLLSVRDETATSYLFDFVRVILTRRST